MTLLRAIKLLPRRYVRAMCVLSREPAWKPDVAAKVIDHLNGIGIAVVGLDYWEPVGALAKVLHEGFDSESIWPGKVGKDQWAEYVRLCSSGACGDIAKNATCDCVVNITCITEDEYVDPNPEGRLKQELAIESLLSALPTELIKEACFMGGYLAWKQDKADKVVRFVCERGGKVLRIIAGRCSQCDNDPDWAEGYYSEVSRLDATGVGESKLLEYIYANTDTASHFLVSWRMHGDGNGTASNEQRA